MMFHLEYPRSHGFMAWDELGCLARALGFPVDLFKRHITDEIAAEENGLPHKELHRLLDYNILSSALHLSLNNHTHDWNVCCIRRAVSILHHKALTFEDLHNARIAYGLYEASDMKGMVIDERIILRTLKMCGKTISPMKLMHRIKHSEGSFEEPGRMQLYEFLDMILWANGYEKYSPDEIYAHYGMEDELFKLVDFEKLLSHHDQRLADKLDSRYLKEEWDFGREKYSRLIKFRDQTVICGDSRAARARSQKQNYRGLRSEVGTSQKMVYCTRSGHVRERPLTAPNLSRYTWSEAEARRRQSIQALRTAHMKMNALIQMAASKGDDSDHENFGVDTSDKPVAPEFKRSPTMKVIKESDVTELDNRWEQLMFDIETEKGRYEIHRDDEIEHYIPGYREKLAEKMEKESAMPSAKVKWKPPRRQKQPDSVIDSLAYPVRRIPPSHAKKCDARLDMSEYQKSFRGWYAVRSKAGPHYILISPHFEDSYKRHLFKKLSRMSESELKKIHEQFLYRYTDLEQVDARPVTAPAVLDKKDSAKSRRNKASASSGYSSMDDQSKLEKGASENEPNSNLANPDNVKESLFSGDDNDTNVKITLCKDMSDFGTEIDDGILSIDSGESLGVRDFVKNKSSEKYNVQRCKSAFVNVNNSTENEDTEKETGRSKSAMEKSSKMDTSTPMPYMEHSQPRVVSVGSIGKISLLESITESRYWEDVYGRDLAETFSEGQGNHGDEVDLSMSSSSDSEEEKEIINRSRRKSRQKKCKSKARESDDAFLAIVVDEDKRLQRKQSNDEDRFMENLGLKPHKKRRSRASVSSAKSLKSHKSPTRKTAASPPVADKEVRPVSNSKLNDPHMESSTTEEGKQHNGKLEPQDGQQNELLRKDPKKHGNIIKRESTLSGSSSRSSGSKYTRLAKRMGDDISNRLNSLLST